MQLQRLTMQNFRCYTDATSIEVEDLTVLVGRNDAGKSTILDALNIFFGNSKLDADDRSKAAEENADIVITCEFSDLPVSIDIDAGHSTTLAAEHLTTGNGTLRIKKVFKGKTPALKAVLAIANHPTAQHVSDLLSLKRTQLQQRADVVGANLANVNEGINAMLRAAIRNAIVDLDIQEVEIPLDKEDAKAVWEKIDACMPVFALFKSDRDSKDGDEEAQDPLNAAVATAIKDKSADLDVIFDYVADEVQKTANATLAKLRQMDPSLANQLTPRFDKPTWSKLFKASIVGDSGIPVNKRGSGVRRLILLNFFRSMAERLVHDKKAPSVIYAIEEPETSQHPNNQRMLVRALQELLQSEKCQVVITTHNPLLARVFEVSKLRHVKTNDDGKQTVEPITNDNWPALANSLGVLPETTVGLFIFVEGKHDIPFLMNIADCLRADGFDTPDLRKLELDGRVIFAPLGGNNLLLWSNRAKPLLKPEFHLSDRDFAPPADPKYKDAIDAVMLRAAKGENVYATCTTKRELENYIHIDAINDALIQHGSPPLVRNASYADFDDVPARLTADLNAVAPNHALWNVRTTKTFLNNQAVTRMSAARLQVIDPNGELLGWFARLNQMLH